MPNKKRRPRWRRFLLAGLGLALVLLAALPLWFPWVLKPVLGQIQVRYGRYNRLGYNSFALHELTLEQPGLRITAQRARIPLPWTWLWWRLFQSAPDDALTATDWQVQLLSQPRQDTPPGPSMGAPGLLVQLEELVNTLKKWLPPSQLTNGSVCQQDECVQIPSLNWNAPRLQSTIRSSRWPEPIEVRTDFTGPYRIQLETDSASVTAQVEKTPSAWKVDSQLTWLTNQATLNATFAGQQWLPQTARFEAPALTLPAQLLNLPEGYQDPSGSARWEWENGQFNAHITAHAAAVESSPYPPLQGEVHLAGNTEGIRIDQIQIEAPYLNVTLSRPVSLDYQGQLLSGPADLHCNVDLSQLPLPGLTGQLAAQAQLQPRPNAPPESTFSLSGSNLVVSGVPIKTTLLTGRLDWPLLIVDQLNVQAPNQATLILEGACQLSSRTLTNTHWQLSGDPWPQLVPTNWTWQTLQATGSLSGPLTNLAHRARIQLRNLAPADFEPLSLEADWSGEQLLLSEANLKATQGPLTLELAAQELGWSSGEAIAHLNRLDLTDRDTQLYRLEHPATARFSPATNGTWHLQLSPCSWVGQARNLQLTADVHWPRAGQLQLAAQKFQAQVLTNFLSLPKAMTRLSLDQLDLAVQWTNGPLQGTLAAQVSYPGEPELSGSADVVLSNRLQIRHLLLRTANEPVFQVDGELPFQIRLDPLTAKLDSQAPLHLQAHTRSNQVVWGAVENLIGLRLQQPALDLSVEGSLDQPKGALQATAQQMLWVVPTNTPIEFNQVNLLAHFHPSELDLENASAQLQESPITLTGKLHFGESFWTNLLAGNPLAQWRQWQGEAKLAELDLSPLAGLVPELLLPQGTLSASARLEPGGQANGLLEVHNASTKPLASLGPVREINVTVGVSNSVARLKAFAAKIAGQPIQADGYIDLTNPDEPSVGLHLKGENIRLINEVGLSLRADVDLAATQTNSAPPLISGRVRLRDGLMLQDLRSLRPGGLNQPSQRPPYFKISQDPLAAWQLQVEITGTEFVNVRTPLFQGKLSALLNLQGTLGDPVALGDLRVDQGTLTFPFANLSVQQGLISLTRQSPYDPALFIMSEARAYGYNLSMQVSGTATEPTVTFSSTPPLSSEQVLLMLTTGELPRSDYRFSNEQRVTRLAMFLGRDLLSRLGSNDSSDRLLVRSGEDFSEEGELTYHIEYKLTDRWSLVGEYDRFNALNAGLKWRIYSK